MNKQIVINSCIGGYMVFVDDHPLPWVYNDIDKLLAKIREEFINETEVVTDRYAWVQEELEKA